MQGFESQQDIKNFFSGEFATRGTSRKGPIMGLFQGVKKAYEYDDYRGRNFSRVPVFQAPLSECEGFKEGDILAIAGKEYLIDAISDDGYIARMELCQKL